jgi:two-component system response regulator MprA
MTAMPMADRSVEPEGQPTRSVLVVDGDDRVASFLDRSLSAAGYRVERAPDGPQALAAFDADPPDVVLLDVAVPGMEGLELARRLRARSGVPIVLLGATDAVDDRVAGLDAGADEYLTKPVAVEELLARMRALFRGRALAAASAIDSTRHGILSFADIRVDLDAREALRGQRRLELRNKTFELLACFLRHPERVLSRRELLEEVWGYEFLGDSNVIEVTVGHVRQALEAGGEPRLIHTIRPVGYILHARTAS